jgi:glycosyltransferase involved in cell wall biosynthesis
MKMLFVAGREPAYVRNAMMLKCLDEAGVEILDCTDSSASYPARYLVVMRKFLSRKKEYFDCVFVGFFGQPLVPLIRLFTDKPIILDAYLSAYDTICFDRKIFKPGSLAGRFLRWLDRYSCEKSAVVLLDTNEHISYFCNTFGLSRGKFHRVLVGADESVFFPRPMERNDGKFRVFYYCSFLPLHGAEYVIGAAAALCSEQEIEFLVAGQGPERERIAALAKKGGADNVRFIDWLPFEALPGEIAQADCCLGGHFSAIEKAKRVIAGKTFQFIAMKKPVIVGDCPGNRELFSDRQNALFVKMADADSLAHAILELKKDATLRGRIAEAGYETFLKFGATGALTKELRAIIDSPSLIRRGSGGG